MHQMMHSSPRKDETRDALHVKMTKISRARSPVSIPFMRITRIYTPTELAKDKKVALTPAGVSHVAKVLRARIGDTVAVFDGAGNEYRATIDAITAKNVVVTLTEAVATASESPLKITLVQGISRGERMDWVVQKTTELGIAAIVPVITGRSVVKLDRDQAAKRHEHWRNIAIGACEQCGRAQLPELHPPISLGGFLEKNHRASVKWVLDPAATQSLIGLCESRNTDTSDLQLLIGPEGGLGDDELAAAKRAGFVPVCLGPRILRTETAAVAAIALVQGMWGDLGK